jgi:short-subunit dehydrogenase
LKAIRDKIEILILNASQNFFGETAGDVDRERELLGLNVLSFHLLTTFFKQTLASRQGSLVGVTSIASLYPVGFQNLYHATKSFQLSFLCGLKRENPGFHVMPVVLGPFFSNMNIASGLSAERGQWLRSHPGVLARRIWRDLDRKAEVSKPDIFGKLSWFLFRFHLGHWLGCLQTSVLRAMFIRRKL